MPRHKLYDGKVYQYTTSGLLKSSSHFFQFTASDSTAGATGDTGEHSGPAVANSPPTAPVVNVTPDEPFTDDDLVCTVTVPSSDPESDTITYKYEWYKNDEQYLSGLSLLSI